jgi:aspartate/methionine/tyrosine aminotransferase
MPLSTRINRNILELEYAVRGPIPQRAAELQRQGRRIIPCNIGNPQALGQKPITYYRQALSLLESPGLIERERRLRDRGEDLIPEEILDLCEGMLSRLSTGMGAYTESQGPLFIREAIAAYIDARDGGVPSSPDDIFLTDGASQAAKYLIDMFIADDTCGIMIPIPQYPLYSAAIRKAGGVQVDYHPDEESGWTLPRSVLEESYEEATGRGVTIKAIVVINPCNPTGAILPEDSARDVVDFAREKGLAIIADEVYQENLYGADWISFASVVGDQDVPLFSLHSTSKGFYGECGHRGGYLEIRNPPVPEGTDLAFKEILLKLASVSLCSNTAGQALTYLMVTPPPEGTEVRRRFDRERAEILNDLLRKATLLREAFRKMDAMDCFGRTGALYLFPRIGRLPPGKTDFDYCMGLLEETGLCTVNGSGFGQKEGTHHLRIAFLPPTDVIEEVVPGWIDFHNRYVGT